MVTQHDPVEIKAGDVLAKKPPQPESRKIATFRNWAGENHWLLIGSGADIAGCRSYNYLTPSGNIVMVKSDLAGNVTGIGGKGA